MLTAQSMLEFAGSLQPTRATAPRSRHSDESRNPPMGIDNGAWL